MKTKLLSLFPIFILLIFCQTVFSQSASQNYKLGKKAALDGKTIEAIDYFTKAIELSPKDYDYLSARGKQYELKKEFEKAITDYDSALSAHAKDEELAMHIADLNISLNKYEDAVTILKYILTRDDSNFEAIEKLADCLLKIKDYNEVIHVCTFAINYVKHKNDYYYHYYIAIAKDSMKDYNFACAEYDTALLFRQTYDKGKTPINQVKPFYVNYAIALNNAKKYDDAIKYFSMALSIDMKDSLSPKNYKIYYHRSFPEAAKTNYNEAIGDLTRALIANPNEREIVYQRGIMYQKTRQFLNAINDFTKYLQLNNQNPEAYYNRGLCNMEVDKYNDAVNDFKKAVSIGKGEKLPVYNSSLHEAQNKLYQLNKESDPPEIAVEFPVIDKDNYINVLENQYEVVISGRIKDKSQIEYIKINDNSAAYNPEELNPEFKCHLKLNDDLRSIEVKASDVYHNVQSKTIKVGHIISETKMKVAFAGRIVTDDDARIPYSDKDVYMVDVNDEVFMLNRTDANGHFRFTNLPLDKDYFLTMDVKDSPLAEKHKFIVTDDNNNAMLSSKEDGKQRFKFQILPTDINTLSLMTLDDEPVLIDLKGRLYGSDDTRKPIANVTLQLFNKKGDLVANKKTDELGSFLFSKLSPKEDYIIKTDAEESKTILFNRIVITDDKGKIIREIVKNASGIFEYHFLPAEKNQLAAMSAIDPWLKTLKLSKNRKEVIIIENIYYESGSADILPEAELVLLKAIEAMKNNSKINIEIQSHTDAIAGDDYNMDLSQRRANTVVSYMVSKGIDKKRLTAKGFGETQLTNRCANGVECSDAEHKQNRRTVFKINYVGQ